MKTVYLLIIIPILSFSQTKKIYLIDKNNKLVNRFEVIIYQEKDSVVITNKKKPYFNLKKKYDSISINYNIFYNTKIYKKHFNKIDTIFLKNIVSLDEIEIKNKVKEIGTNGKIRSYGTAPDSQGLIRIDISKYKNYSLKYISFFLLNKYKNSFVSKNYLYNKDKKFELLLFQSNHNTPNKENISLLNKPYFITINEIYNKEWMKINLSNLNIEIKKYRYIYVGFKNIKNYIGYGFCKRKKNKNIEYFYRTTAVYSWQKIKWHTTSSMNIPAIRLGLKE